MSPFYLARFSAALTYVRLLGWETNRTTFFCPAGPPHVLFWMPNGPHLPWNGPDWARPDQQDASTHDHTFYVLRSSLGMDG
jgi:hypothetical protein